VSSPGNTPRASTHAKRGFCPDCGGPGTFVLPSFITCDRRCGFADDAESDGVPTHVDSEHTVVVCKWCGEDETKKWGPEMRVGGLDLWTCRKCGKSFHA
jgi:hypothetical protein